MRVIIDFEFSDEERELITKHERLESGARGLPKLATRVMLRKFVESAVNNAMVHAADDVEKERA